MIIRLFRGAGATGYVFCLKHGTANDQGLAWSGLIGPMTTVAVVPTTTRIIQFSIEARTKDKQTVTATGNLKVILNPTVAVSRFDFTVNPKNGSYQSEWQQELQAAVIENVLGPIYAQAKSLDVADAIQSHKEFENAVRTAITGANSPLLQKGVTVESCSIAKVTADEEVETAIGSKERQAMLTEADKALNDRRLKAAANERSVRTYESETALRLEEERAKIVERQGENKKKEAEADAAATQTRLEPFTKAEAGKILGAAIMKMAESGRIGNLSIVPEMLAALQQK